MTLSTRAIALQGIGFTPLLVAVQGFSGIAAPAPSAPPATVTAGKGGGRLERGAGGLDGTDNEIRKVLDHYDSLEAARLAREEARAERDRLALEAREAAALARQERIRLQFPPAVIAAVPADLHDQLTDEDWLLIAAAVVILDD